MRAHASHAATVSMVDLSCPQPRDDIGRSPAAPRRPRTGRDDERQAGTGDRPAVPAQPDHRTQPALAHARAPGFSRGGAAHRFGTIPSSRSTAPGVDPGVV